ncbi:thioredoxin-dependent thiol peroxidase, partial [bacterium]|nr:thioredoxin-dependent thiol peroxidase [bacterium]
MTKITIRKKAPQFILNDQNGKPHKLSDYLGKKVLLYFYPKDMTSGCTLEAQGFRDLLPKFTALDVAILGISIDDEKTHKKFCDKEELTFPLLADVDKKVVQAYGVWVEKSMYGRKYLGIQRDSFLIDETGTIIKHYEKVKPIEHPA